MNDSPAPFNTVADLVAAQATLEVACRNCGRRHVFSHRFLIRRLGYTGHFRTASFRCGQCQQGNVRLAIVPRELADRDGRPMTWFGGVYEKFRD